MAINMSVRDGIAVIELDRKEAMNALNHQLLLDLASALDSLQAIQYRGLVFTGAGDKAFCAGADIVELKERTPAEHRHNVETTQWLFERIHQLDVPSVAAIQGYAFGGGLELALACTFRIANSKAKLGLPEAKLGLIPGYGGTQRLPRIVGEARALELILSGRSVNAEEAHAMGLVNQIFEQQSAIEAGLAYISAVTSYSPTAAAHALRAVRRGLEAGLVQGLSIEADQFALSAQSRDAHEGMAAFIEKRSPAFGRG
ncbi:enoyl-CoA hydratase/isomerase family protein [Parapusillimonas sp. JC17]|uniref:enoyl-CoA hydratase/isomerase family protein n=1 Tax=Parapusillimonas sp. JC17 TaxID=3445768 RepID=UPI003F9F2517